MLPVAVGLLVATVAAALAVLALQAGNNLSPNATSPDPASTRRKPTRRSSPSAPISTGMTRPPRRPTYAATGWPAFPPAPAIFCLSAPVIWS
jgi:hypothetical protein